MNDIYDTRFIFVCVCVCVCVCVIKTERDGEVIQRERERQKREWKENDVKKKNMFCIFRLLFKKNII